MLRRAVCFYLDHCPSPILPIGSPGLLILLLCVLAFLAVVLYTGLIYQIDYIVPIRTLALGTTVFVPFRLYPLGSDVEPSVLLSAVSLQELIVTCTIVEDLSKGLRQPVAIGSPNRPVVVVELLSIVVPIGVRNILEL